MTARLAAVMALAATLAGCAARVPARPPAASTPDPSAVARFVEATRACPGMRTLTAELRLAGRVGTERIRARLIAGFAAPASIRLEAVAPFGPPGFILAGVNDRARLVFPRERQVLDEAAVPDVLDALAGLDLGAGDLRRIVSGCVADAEARDGRNHGRGWTSVALGAETRVYLRERQGRTLVVAADHDGWQIDYAAHVAGIPRQVRVRRAGTGVDLTAEVASLEINVPVPDAAFVVDAPANAEVITLGALRAASPLHAREP
ncbi:MAG: hypothetical protein ACLGHP_00120 [Vicinamibacteria bacterium]